MTHTTVGYSTGGVRKTKFRRYNEGGLHNCKTILWLSGKGSGDTRKIQKIFVLQNLSENWILFLAARNVGC